MKESNLQANDLESAGLTSGLMAPSALSPMGVSAAPLPVGQRRAGRALTMARRQVKHRFGPARGRRCTSFLRAGERFPLGAATGKLRVLLELGGRAGTGPQVVARLASVTQWKWPRSLPFVGRRAGKDGDSAEAEPEATELDASESWGERLRQHRL